MQGKIPEFSNPDEEVEFWREHSVLEFVGLVDLSDFLKRGGNKSVVVALRMEPLVREQTRQVAVDLGKNYQTLMREWICDGLRKALEEKHEGKSTIEKLMHLVVEMKEDLEEIKGSIQLPEFDETQGNVEAEHSDALSEGFSIFPPEYIRRGSLDLPDDPFGF